MCALAVIRQIGRRIATDKMILCLLLVILLAILAVIVLKVGSRAVICQGAPAHAPRDTHCKSDAA